MQIEFAQHPILQEALVLIKKLEEAGHAAYFVGGAVRDVLLGREIQDVDIATSAHPDQTLHLFSKTLATGLQHGTITVVHNQINYEITTFRVESEYENFRRPERVAFVQELKLDLARRDFTINAMAINAIGEVVDYFDGQLHLQEQRLVAVGNAEQRFKEDALRMVRAVRFATTYSLTCDEAVWQAILQHGSLLNHISMERIHQELHKMLKGCKYLDAFKLLYESELLLHTKKSIQLHEVLRQWFTSRSKPSTGIEYTNGLWAVLYAYSTLSLTDIQQDLSVLVFSKKMTNEISLFIEWLRFCLQLEKADSDSEFRGIFINKNKHYLDGFTNYKYFQLSLRDEKSKFRQIVTMYWQEQAMYDAEARSIFTNEILSACGLQYALTLCNRIEDDQVIHKLTQLNINGKQLATALKLEPDVWLKSLLQKLYFAVNLRLVKNEEESLIAAALKLINENEGVL